MIKDVRRQAAVTVAAAACDSCSRRSYNTDVDNVDAIRRETLLTTTQLMACGALYIGHSPHAVAIINVR